MQQAILHLSFPDIHAVSQDKTALELPRGDPAMQKYAPFAVIALFSTDHELPIFDSAL